MYRSMRVSRVFVNASRVPSGEKPISPMCASAGTLIVRSALVAIVRSVMPVPLTDARGPLFAGLTRMPARPSHGLASSAIAGIDRRDPSAITSRNGLTATPGSGAASMMSTIAWGGF